jgi:uncharacterized coiled-coil DUF342 family protein
MTSTTDLEQQIADLEEQRDELQAQVAALTDERDDLANTNALLTAKVDDAKRALSEALRDLDY